MLEQVERILAGCSIKPEVPQSQRDFIARQTKKTAHHLANIQSRSRRDLKKFQKRMR